MHERDDVRQLHGAFDARVAGEDLLEQRGPRARQADDEDRSATRIAAAGVRGKEFQIKEDADARAAALEAFDVEGGIEPAQRVAPRVVFEGPGVFLPVLERLAERKV